MWAETCLRLSLFFENCHLLGGRGRPVVWSVLISESSCSRPDVSTLTSVICVCERTRCFHRHAAAWWRQWDGVTHTKKKRGSQAVRQVARREWTLLHVDPDNKAVSVMQQVSSAVIIREAGHTHTSAEGSRAVGGTEHGSVKLHVILMAIMSANESTPVNFTARSISDQLTWLSSAAAVLLTGDCVQWLMFTAWQHLTPRHPAQFSKYIQIWGPTRHRIFLMEMFKHTESIILYCVFEWLMFQSWLPCATWLLQCLRMLPSCVSFWKCSTTRTQQHPNDQLPYQ